MSTLVDEVSRPIRLGSAGTVLDGNLTVPQGACRLVLVAHAGQRRRLAHRELAAALNSAELATLSLDLLTGDEAASDDETNLARYEVNVLARRLIAAIDWAAKEEGTAMMSLGILTSSTGAAAAMLAAASRPARVGAIAVRSGWPHLAGVSLRTVFAPTLFIAGEHDTSVRRLNEDAISMMRCLRKIEVIEGAAHDLDEPAFLESAARLASDWFRQYLGSR